MPNVLSEGDLAQLGGIVQDLVMRDTCDILRMSQTQDIQGGAVETYSPIAGGPFACGIINARPKFERVYEEQLETRVYKQAVLPRGMMILGDDRIRVYSTQNGVPATLTYRVVGLYSPQSFDTHTLVDVLYDASL